MTTPDINQRKNEHIDIVLNKEVEPLPSSFDVYQLPYKALPEIDMNEIDLSAEIFKKALSFPFIIASMTGGPEKGKQINIHLAEAAEEVGVAMGLGSMRATIEKPETLASFNIRSYCPSIALIANVGLVQLNYGFGVKELNAIIDSVEADALYLHVNPLQEAIQPEGDTNFKGLIHKLEKILPKLHAPVIVKEVGTGIDPITAKHLYEIGVKWIDVAGTGGTSWAWVEGYRRKLDSLGYLFRAEGYPTTELVQIIRYDLPKVNLIASGGVRTGVDIAKSIALGANYASCAKPLLAAALDSTEAVVAVLNNFKKELQIAMFMTGCEDLTALCKLELIS